MSIHNSPTSPVTAVVLAGGDATDPLAAHYGVKSKAHVPFRGRPLVSQVLTALAGSSLVTSTVYVGTQPEGLEHQPDYSLPSGKLYSDSAALGLGAALAVAPGSRLLLVTGDLPWLSSTAVDGFLAQATDDLNYPIIRKETALRQFPDQKRTWVKLKQGQ